VRDHTTPIDLAALRRDLHRHPELAGREAGTAGRLRELLAGLAPDDLVAGLGGHGLAAVFRGAAAGPRVLLRCELDALPQPEFLELPHGSTVPGVAHKCGHDGHMAMMVGAAADLAAERPARGEVVFLFQPAEETGEGAARVIADPAFARLEPDRAFALHNLPGEELGAVLWRRGPFACASEGLVVELTGASAHAGEPEAGRSPALALAGLIQALSEAPRRPPAFAEDVRSTVVHARLGEEALGTTPGRARLVATLRAVDPSDLERLAARCRAIAMELAAAHGLAVSLWSAEPFPATVNDTEVAELAATVAGELGLALRELPRPLPWSEDFGHFTARCPGALVGLGAGTGQPPLHHPDYDFPDALIEPGRRLLAGIARRLTRAGDA